MNIPAIQLYLGDYLRDAVSGCSLAAQGLWLRLLMMMHDSERYGYLCHNGVPIPSQMLARRCGCSLEEFNTCLAELEAAGVPSRTQNGIIYCRRMARIVEDREKNAARQRRFYENHKRDNGNPNLTANLTPKTLGSRKPNGNLTVPQSSIPERVPEKPNGSANGTSHPSSFFSLQSSIFKENINTAPTVTTAVVEPPVDNSYDGKELWEVGKDLLIKQGMNPRSAGAFIGKLCRDYGRPQVQEAVRTALVNKPADVASYLPGVLKKSGKGVNGIEFKSIKQLRVEAVAQDIKASGEEWLRRRGIQRAINEGKLTNGEVITNGHK